MLYKDMAKLMAHLQDPATIKKHGLGACAMFQAFAATGFTLWTRNEELTGLQGKDISSMMRTDTDQRYFTTTLKFRKTNQADEKKRLSMTPPDENIPVAANINGNTVIGGTLQSNSRLTTGEFVLIHGVAEIGQDCSPNGLVGRDTNGLLLSCKSGTWASVGEPPLRYSGNNPQCPQDKAPIAKFWTQPDARTDYGLHCILPTGWGGNMNPSCEACFDFERCHILYSQQWNAILCM
ncbi:hypothetical protein EMPS_04053 [Entomortierella parvispora]|uniref:Bacterial shufflon protein N-terminal domain-containing protein n=1 Tax=Entomortierella parvispora TaxID=205924 RepID=A0A9P3LV08_9FUNG|nr:hypothetical protein EMPS_04053 [Entomortierella parvispora]